jgi:hypothetical protein
MIKGLPFTLAFIALPTFSAPQLETEIKAGDIWVQASYSEVDAQLEYINPITNADIDKTTSSSNADLNGLTVLESELAFKPVFGLYLSHENEKLQTARVSFGLIGKTSSNKNIIATIAVDHSEYPNQRRGSVGFELHAQTTDLESRYYNQIGFLISIPKDEGEEKGGELISLVNKFKLSPIEKIDTILKSGIIFQKDEKNKTSGGTVSFDPAFLIGGELAFNFTSQLSASLSITKAFMDRTNEDKFSNKFDMDVNATLYEVEFIGRF